MEFIKDKENYNKIKTVQRYVPFDKNINIIDISIESKGIDEDKLFV